VGIFFLAAWYGRRAPTDETDADTGAGAESRVSQGGITCTGICRVKAPGSITSINTLKPASITSDAQCSAVPRQPGREAFYSTTTLLFSLLHRALGKKRKKESFSSYRFNQQPLPYTPSVTVSLAIRNFPLSTIQHATLSCLSSSFFCFCSTTPHTHHQTKTFCNRLI
jgi:hypothetical protein